ncbi:hypothetical protein TH24_02855 [Thalassospira xiamenensis]|nr:hypothetical protein TH24_02855 [Thalassospira xiamenensis]
MVFDVMFKLRSSVYVRIFSIFISIAIIFYFYEFSDIWSVFYNINYYLIFASLFLVVGNQLLSSVRFKVSLSVFGVGIRFSESNRINIYSIISGLVFFNFLGQSLSRSYLVGNSLGKEAAFFLTAVERVLSVSVLLIAALLFSLMCFGGISFDAAPALMVFLTVSFVFISCGVYFFFQLSDRQILGVSQIFSKSVGGGLFWMLLITIAMHLFMLGSYLCLVVGIVGPASLSIFAVLAALLTMLGASLPISFGGWGVREVTAGFAFDAASLSPELGVAVGVGVGILTIIALGINICTVWGLDIFLRSKSSVKIFTAEKAVQDSRLFISTLAWVLPIIISVLIMVQLPLPIGGGRLTVNLADPVAIVCGMTFLFVFFHRKMWSKAWDAKFSAYAFMGLISVILIGFLFGYFRYGYLSWAFYNRLIGAGLLASYFISGMALYSFWGRDGVIYMTRIIVVAVATMVLFEYLSRTLMSYEDIYLLGWGSPQWLGLFGNPNAYAFFLVCCFPVVFIFSNIVSSSNGKNYFCLYSAILLVGIYYTGSRSSYISIFFVVLFLCFSNWKKSILTVVLAFLFVCILYFSHHLIPNFDGKLNISAVEQSISFDRISNVQDDRMLSLTEGWKMFLDFPIFGAGLGAFYHQQTNAGIPLVIHNSFLWVLAEFGLFGFIIVFGPIGIFAAKNLINASWRRDDKMYALLAILLGASIMGLAHEMMYQRILWLLLGVFLTNPLPREAREQWSVPKI